MHEYRCLTFIVFTALYQISDIYVLKSDIMYIFEFSYVKNVSVLSLLPYDLYFFSPPCFTFSLNFHPQWICNPIVFNIAESRLHYRFWWDTSLIKGWFKSLELEPQSLQRYDGLLEIFRPNYQEQTRWSQPDRRRQIESKLQRPYWTAGLYICIIVLYIQAANRPMTALKRMFGTQRMMHSDSLRFSW
jgi:hypothetical protein